MLTAVSEAKLAANRANAQLSSGPKSDAGKAKVSLNAVKTGLTGRTVLLPGDDVAAYEGTIAHFKERWQPATEEERTLVQSLADTDWRLARIPGLEYGIFAMGEREFADEFADETDPDVRRTMIQTKVFLVYGKKLTSLQCQEARFRRHRLQDEQRLEKLQNLRKNKEIDQVLRDRREAEKAANAVKSTKPVRYAPPQTPNDGGFEFVTPEEIAKIDSMWAEQRLAGARRP